jgi:hypothetical protein
LRIVMAMRAPATRQPRPDVRQRAAGRAIIDVNGRYFNDTARCARPHKNDFFIGIGCFFGGSCVYDGEQMCWDAKARGEAVRHDSCGRR